MQNPLISIAIPTYNSELTLENTLKSIKKQTYPQSKIEILIIDGGSKDNTINIAHKYKTKVIKNVKTDIIYAKQLGFLNAKGKYLINIDSDESIVNADSLEKRIQIFQNNNNIKAIMLSGYVSPKKGHPINDYVNEFGDPFSYFIYKQSKGYKYLQKDLQKNYRLIKNDKDFSIFDFNHKTLPLIELWAGSCMIDFEYVNKVFPQIRQNPSLIAHLFYLINNDKKLLAVMKDDPTEHDSNSSYKRYFKKITSRVKSNIFNTDMGASGYSGRSMVSGNNYKKYLFIPYSLSIIFPCIDGLYLSITRKKTVYLLHPILTLYTALLILYFMTLKTLGKKVLVKNYGV